MGGWQHRVDCDVGMNMGYFSVDAGQTLQLAGL